jgi:subtilisin family serine protease
VADEASPPDNRLLVKLRPSSRLRAAESRANLQPLLPSASDAAGAFGISADARWYVAEIPAGAATPWDLAHARVADQLGVAPSDVVFAEPDLVHSIYDDPETVRANHALAAAGQDCQEWPQEESNGKAKQPNDGWHLGDGFSQLQRARDAVTFTDPRTRIAHLDTGYFRAHKTVPRRINHDLERNFVGGDGKPTSADDPDNKRLLLDNSGHGTGTLSILAGNDVDFLGGPMGAAPDAEIVPLRIADSVVLLYTSAFARALDYAIASGCDVLSMSMGGLPSDAWNEAIDRAYLAGLCMVTAAGNNFAGLATRKIVYPARYRRVIAACGVMANEKPYAHLLKREMEGNYGPDKVMEHALAAYTPNIPWAVFGCENVVRRNGAGTSSATPQIAAAAALYFEKYKNILPRDWRRVEAVRNALFSTAKKGNDKQLGQGILRAHDALAVAPNLALKQTKPDNDSFAFLRVLTGLGITEPTARERMFNLELQQRWLLNGELQEIVEDPDAEEAPRNKQLLAFMEAVIADEKASAALRKHLAARYQVLAGRRLPKEKAPKDIVPPVLPACDRQPSVREPALRRIRVYAVDPSFSTRLETAGVNEVTLQIPWEKNLQPGPVGEYLAVRDVDAAGQEYPPLDLNDVRLAAQHGWAPSEGNAQFHQQMVYAVAMKTIGHFERALGRPVLWRQPDPSAQPDAAFVGQLEVRPHALRQANAFYSPTDMALLFGYFETPQDAMGDHMPGGRVYSCLSHDIVAHETTHAILDGMQPLFIQPTNLDVLAFHEAFCDVVALMQHFTLPEVLKLEIGRTRGNLEAETMLGSLAVQFGHAIGSRGALREAIGSVVDGKWKRFAPDPSELHKRQTPHGRGAILVAAVFDAFLAIYNTRTRDLLRIATGGSGELPNGSIHPDLVERLADEASKSAGHVLDICIRALDYLPPVDITFFEYLRALITADYDLVSNDKYNYRVAFVEAFRRRGIYPLDVGEAAAETVRTLSVDTVRWQEVDELRLPTAGDAKGKKPPKELLKQYEAMFDALKAFAQASLYTANRAELYARTREERDLLSDRLATIIEKNEAFAEELGLMPGKPITVHQLRALMRVSPDGRYTPQMVVSLTQSMQRRGKAGTPTYDFHGGATLLVDLADGRVKYRIVKRLGSETRRERTDKFMRDVKADPLKALFFAEDRREPFAALHALAEDG